MEISLLPPFIFFSFLLHPFSLFCRCITSNFLFKCFNVKDIKVVTQGSWRKTQTVTISREQWLWGGGIFKLSAKCTISKLFWKVSKKSSLTAIDLFFYSRIQKNPNWRPVWGVKWLSHISTITWRSLPQLFSIQLQKMVKLGKQIPVC